MNRNLEPFVQRYYREPHRCYHTLQHLDECLAWWEYLRFFDDRYAVKLALIFHDAVYVPGADDNEYQSQLVARQYIKHEELAERVCELISWTTHEKQAFDDDDAAAVQDIDLAILAAHPLRFLEYEKQIRQEYATYDDEAYAKGRLAVLMGFAERDTIFTSRRMVELLEPLAQKNLVWSIGQITQVFS